MMMDQNMPTWAIPLRQDAGISLPRTIPGAKYHCFEIRYLHVGATRYAGT